MNSFSFRILRNHNAIQMQFDICTFSCIIWAYNAQSSTFQQYKYTCPSVVPQICLHWGPEVDPDIRDMADDSWVIDKMKGYVSRHFPELESEPAIAETCMYTVRYLEDLFLFVVLSPPQGYFTYRNPSVLNCLLCSAQTTVMCCEPNLLRKRNWTIFMIMFLKISKNIKKNLQLYFFHQWSEDENFILDRHPTWKNIIIGAGFSGRLF